MSKKDLKMSCRVPGREAPKSAMVKDLRTWILESSGTSKRTIKKNHGPGKMGPSLTGLARGWEDPGFSQEDLEERAPSSTEASREVGVRRGGGGATARRNKTQAKMRQVEAEGGPPYSLSTSAKLASSGRGKGASKGPLKVFGWRPIKRLELVLENLGEGDSKEPNSEEAEEPRTFLRPPGTTSQQEPPEAARRSSLGQEQVPASPDKEEEEAAAEPACPPPWKAHQSFVFGPEVFWQQLRRLRPRPREPYTDFAAQVTGLVGTWVEKAGAGTREEVIELVRLQHVLDQIPEPLAQLVLTQKPKTAMEAAALADQFSFQQGRHSALAAGAGPGIWPWFSRLQAAPLGKGTKKSVQRGHTLGREVTPKKDSQSVGGGKPTLVHACHKCGKMGHTRINCPSWNSSES